MIKSQTDQSSPFITAERATLRFMKVAEVCARAALASFDSRALQARPK
jgi:hypothetical protein